MNLRSRAACLAILLTLLAVSVTRSQLPTADAVPAQPDWTWFKGNLHTHSLWSDGNDYPEMIADWYRQQGYHFLALSDHNVLSQGVRWMNVAEANKRSDADGLERYRRRFGDDWSRRARTGIRSRCASSHWTNSAR